MDEERIVIGSPRPALSKEQKVGLSFVIICGVGALVLGGLYVWRHMAVPFVIAYTGPQILVSTEKSSAEIEKEKNTDTDSDGISDYDEKNIYQTSPYLSDTDSDGVTDYIEITTNQDPNCAAGKTCTGGTGSADAVDESGTSGTFLDNLTAPTPPSSSTDTSSTSAEVQTALDALSAASGASDTGTAIDSGSFSGTDIAKLAGMTVDQIRTLLIQSGADPAKVNAASDTEIDALFHQILASLQTSSSTTNP